MYLNDFDNLDDNLCCSLETKSAECVVSWVLRVCGNFCLCLLKSSGAFQIFVLGIEERFYRRKSSGEYGPCLVY